MSTECAGALRIIYFAPARRALRTLVGHLTDTGHAVVWMPGAVEVRLGDLTVLLKHARSPEEVQQWLEHEYGHLVLVDLRVDDEGTPFDERVRRGMALLDRLDQRDDIEARYGFHRIIPLLSDTDGAAVDGVLLQLGARGIRQTLREGATADAATAGAFAQHVLCESCRIIRGRSVMKTALCLAGGGITGIYFELGVLKCLADCLPPHTLNRLNMLFGISAGAIVSSALAVGYSVDELMASLAGHADTRIPSLDLRLFRFGHLDYRNAVRRSSRALNSAVRWVVDMLRRRRRNALDDLLIDYSDAIGPLFHAERFESMLRTALETAGTNDFRRLANELYIGASDQDARRHVLFGSAPFDSVPISKAAQASLSISPAFPSVEIDGRYFEDGAVTRTSNFIEAIRRDATLVVVVDPFLPYVSKAPGATRHRGLFYHMDQNVRTISYTRFEMAREWVLRRYPEVSVYTFLPSKRQRHLLSINPMDHRPYLEVWRSAYLSTLNRLEHLSHRLAGDFSAHGMPLDMARAQYVARQLEAKSQPDFEDFYPDRELQIPKPPFVGGNLVRPSDEHAIAPGAPIPSLTSTPAA